MLLLHLQFILNDKDSYTTVKKEEIEMRERNTVNGKWKLKNDQVYSFETTTELQIGSDEEIGNQMHLWYIFLILIV